MHTILGVTNSPVRWYYTVGEEEGATRCSYKSASQTSNGGNKCRKCDGNLAFMLVSSIN